MKFTLILGIASWLILINFAVGAATDATPNNAVPPTPTQLPLWRAEAAKWEAVIKNIDAQLAAARQRNATPTPSRSQTGLRTSSLQPSGPIGGSRSGFPSPSPDNLVLLQQQRHAAEVRWEQAKQQIAQLEAAALVAPATQPPGPVPTNDPINWAAEAAKWNAEVKRLEGILGKYESGPMRFQPPSGVTPARFEQDRQAIRAQLDAAKKNAERANAAVGTMQRNDQDAHFAGLPAMNDAFVEPSLADPSLSPSYSETLEFINSRLPAEGKMGFGKELGKMIFRCDGEVFVFDPKELNPEVKFFTTATDATVFGNAGDCSVALQTRNGRKIIQHWYRGIEQSDLTDGIQVQTADKVETEKLAKAFRHLILMFGGKKEAF